VCSSRGDFYTFTKALIQTTLSEFEELKNIRKSLLFYAQITANKKINISA